jgi:hypothetical protein
MKVKLTPEAKKFITVAEMPAVRRIIADMKEDDSTVEDYAEMAIGAAYDGRAYDIVIYKATAEIAKNQRVYNAYGENSDSLDVWITAVAYVNFNEFIELGAYLSDIWQITCDNKKEIAAHMYIRRFKEVK